MGEAARKKKNEKLPIFFNDFFFSLKNVGGKIVGGRFGVRKMNVCCGVLEALLSAKDEQHPLHNIHHRRKTRM